MEPGPGQSRAAGGADQSAELMQKWGAVCGLECNDSWNQKDMVMRVDLILAKSIMTSFGCSTTAGAGTSELKDTMPGLRPLAEKNSSISKECYSYQRDLLRMITIELSPSPYLEIRGSPMNMPPVKHSTTHTSLVPFRDHHPLKNNLSLSVIQ